MSPSALTDSQMACVQDAARHIPPWPRGRFQQQFVEALGLLLPAVRIWPKATGLNLPEVASAWSPI